MLGFVFAYVDPGVGATVPQLTLAGTVGVGAMARLRWQSTSRALGETDESVVNPGEAAESTR